MCGYYHLNKKQVGTFNMNLLEFEANSLKFDAKPFKFDYNLEIN